MGKSQKQPFCDRICDKTGQKRMRGHKFEGFRCGIHQNRSEQRKKDLHFCKSFGADDQIRTGDLILTNGMRCFSKTSISMHYTGFAHIAGRFLYEMQRLQLRLPNDDSPD